MPLCHVLNLKIDLLCTTFRVILDVVTKKNLNGSLEISVIMESVSEDHPVERD